MTKALNRTRGLYQHWQELKREGIAFSADDLQKTSAELRNSIRSIEWDLEDLEDTIGKQNIQQVVRTFKSTTNCCPVYSYRREKSWTIPAEQLWSGFAEVFHPENSRRNWNNERQSADCERARLRSFRTPSKLGQITIQPTFAHKKLTILVCSLFWRVWVHPGMHQKAPLQDTQGFRSK